MTALRFRTSKIVSTSMPRIEKTWFSVAKIINRPTAPNVRVFPKFAARKFCLRANIAKTEWPLPTQGLQWRKKDPNTTYSIKACGETNGSHSCRIETHRLNLEQPQKPFPKTQIGVPGGIRLLELLESLAFGRYRFTLAYFLLRMLFALAARRRSTLRRIV